MGVGKFSDPFLLINFKTYLEAAGKRAVELARVVEKVGRSNDVRFGVAPQFCDIAQVASAVEIPVFAQHIDPIAPGAFTGHVLAESVKAAGASGTVINHSERNVQLIDIDGCVRRAREVDLTTVVCAGTSKLAAAVALTEPDMVAIEPPELIGSGRAVSKERPEIVSDSVRKIRSANPNVRVLCGAGITTGEDLYAALKLGAEGVIVASGVAKSPKPESVLFEFSQAVRKFL